MKRGITFALHSYKGGTGKTTLSSNLAAFYAKNGMRVCLLDFDLYAPSQSIYFRKNPPSFLNNLLRGESGISDVLVDLSAELGIDKGKLLLGFSSPGKEDVRDIEIKHEMKWQLKALRRFLLAKKQLFEDYEIDYLFLDTSPGIRYWSINTLAAADVLFLVMKNSDMDIEGTKKMVSDIYRSLTKFGSRYFIILNKVPRIAPISEGNWDTNEKKWESEIEESIGTKVVGSVPCFCDIQFSRHEFLFTIKQPNHPFSKRMVTLAKNIENLNLV
jgi:chromosome partitioning protein